MGTAGAFMCAAGGRAQENSRTTRPRRPPAFQQAVCPGGFGGGQHLCDARRQNVGLGLTAEGVQAGRVADAIGHHHGTHPDAPLGRSRPPPELDERAAVADRGHQLGGLGRPVHDTGHALGHKRTDALSNSGTAPDDVVRPEAAHCFPIAGAASAITISPSARASSTA